MKFSQKIFLVTFAFVTFSINFIGIIIIENNYKTQINARMESDVANIQNVSNILDFYNSTELNSNLFHKDNIFYEIMEDNQIIYTNLPSETTKIRKVLSFEDYNINAVISDEYLYMALKSKNYEIILAENIEDIFKVRKEQIYFFIKASVSISFIIALCLYIAILFVTRKIKKLDRAVVDISNGNYGARVPKLGNDEFGNLAISFNKMAKSVEKNIKEIQRVSENRKNFIHNITHEIRTPLTSIIGYSSLVKNNNITDRAKIIEYNNKIHEEGEYLNLISQRLMDIVLMDNKDIKLEKIDFSKTVSELVINHTPKEFENVRIIVDIEPDIQIKSDKVLLHSLIINIIKNGIRAYGDYDEKIIIVALEKINSSEAILRIIDQGCGMTDEQLERIVEPFYTLSSDRNRKTSGMGLGIPLCIKICEVLNAKLKIQSKYGQGTSVNIVFQLDEAEVDSNGDE